MTGPSFGRSADLESTISLLRWGRMADGLQSMEEALHALARRIRVLRERQGLTQEDFAMRCGISVSFTSLLERGIRTPSVETLLQIARTLLVEPGVLFNDESTANSNASGRVLDFIRRQKLNDEQLNRLLTVAEAMFGHPFATASLRLSLCQFPNCEKQALARGLCTAHYHRARRAKR